MTVSIAELMQKMIDAGAPIDAVMIAVKAIEDTKTELQSQIDHNRATNAAKTAKYRTRLGIPFAEWDRLRKEVFVRDGYICVYCGSNVIDNAHCDHIHPVSLGGGNNLENLATTCRRCNSSKGGKIVADWIGRQ